MLRYFPVAYEDELLYSQIARYHRHTCSPGYKQTLSELFDSRTVAAVVDLPAHLERLQQHTEHITRQSAHDILWQQTLFPVYAPFLEADLAEKVKNSMLSEYGGDIHTRAGLAASSVKRPERLRVCPECLKEQLQQNGEAYWQRLFQIAGVLVCPFHSCQLRATAVPYVPLNKHEYTATPATPLKEQEAHFSAPEIEKLSLIARDFSLLLQGDYKPTTHLEWTARYRHLLNDRQLTRGKTVKQRDLLDGFTAFWGSKVLAALSSTVSRGDEHSWLTAMARKHRKNVHPVRHILLYRYLVGVNAPLADMFKQPVMNSEPVASTVGKELCTSATSKDRKRWLILQKEHPGFFAKQLRQMESALYARLYRQDREWLQNHIPHQLRCIPVNNRVDWVKRDRALARKIIRQYQRLKKEENRPRCSAKLLAQRAGCLSMVEKHLAKLPVTRQALKKYAESITDYQCLRVDWAVSGMLLRQEPVLSWKIYRRANIRANVSEEVKGYIKGKVDGFVKASAVPPSTQGEIHTDISWESISVSK